MSALQPLSGGKRTHCGHVVTAVFDPKPTSRLSPPPSPSRASKVARRAGGIMNFLQAFINETARCEENGDSRLERDGPKVRPFELPIASTR